MPSELFQKRTSRKNRVLISWKVVNNNELTIDQLKSFSGGVAVEFINNDFFDVSNQKNEVFKELKKRLGSDDIVSSIISIRSEDGSSSSQVQRDAFNKLINNTEVLYKGEKVIINKTNYEEYAIKKEKTGGIGNDKWSGFLYISIRGGQQDTIETHKDQELTIFNPACEFATEDVCDDLDLTVAYFAMLSVNKNDLDDEQKQKYDKIWDELNSVLKNCCYDSSDYNGNLLDYVQSHLSVKMVKEQLTDVIQLKRIDIKDFSSAIRDADSIDFTHNEAVVNEKYYWDKEKVCLLSPARPTNIFWSFHLSNMMQQDFSLEGYFKNEEDRYNKRKKLLEKSKFSYSP